MNFQDVELTTDQKKQWDETMALMAWTAPGFRHLWYRLLNKDGGQYVAKMAKFNYSEIYGNGNKQPGVACTDGQNVICNPDTFFKYTLQERVFIGAHEVAHNVYDDIGLLHRMRNETNVTCSDGSVFPYKHEIMQKAMDYRINAMLVEGRIGRMPADALYDPDIACAKEGVLDIYGKVYKNDPDNPQGQNGFDQVAPPGASTGQNPTAASQRNPQQWAMEVAQASQMESIRYRGNMPGALKHFFGSILDPKIPWTDHIETLCKRMMGTGSYNWKRPDRRFIGRDLWLPGRGGEGAGWLVIWGDTSGSIGENDLNRYLAEMKGMVEDLRPERLTVIWNDAQIHRVDEVTDVADIDKIKAEGCGGRGGTDITPVFDWINDQNGAVPDMFIGMTDGEFSFPDKPNYPIIWASINDDKSQYPYGEVVPINS